MTLTRRFGALAALALTLVLGACSTPADVSVPGLEAQFGGEYNDYGTDVSFSSSGRIFGLAEEGSADYYYDEDYDEYLYQSRDDVYLNRYDAGGRLVWSKYVVGGYYYELFDHGAEAMPISVQSDKNGVSYVFVSEQDSIYSGEYENVVYKYDLSGNLIRTIYLDYLEAQGASGAVDSAGNLYFANTDGSAGYVSKYTTAGTLVWKRPLSVGITADVSVASNGNVFVTGTTGVSRLTSSGSVAWTKVGAGDKIAASGTNVYVKNKATVRKLDVNGRQLWSKAQSGLSGIVVGDMTADASGNVYLTGKYSATTTNRNIFTRKLNSSGTVLFTKTFGTSAYDDARGIATINGSEIYITGSTQGSLAHAYRGGENDGYISKLSSSGSTVWTR